MNRALRALKKLRAWISPASTAPDRWNLERTDDCIEYLITRTAWLAKVAACPRVTAVAAQPDSQHPVVRGLRQRGLQVELMTIAEIQQGKNAEGASAAIACLDLDSRNIAAAASACLRHPQLNAIPFEYATATEVEFATLRRHDDPNYSAIYFHSPLLLDEAEPLRIYEESLKLFERKCDVRDFMDLYQALKQVVRLGVRGDIAEFGSYKGHSGYLLASSLQALRSTKKLYLFDTFESFPEEAAGVDQFWSSTCEVDFVAVKSKFAELGNVTLVKGEFTQTLPVTPLQQLAFVHVDCDSYRAIRYVTDQVYPLLSPGGVLVFEDYGHPALLGARLAVEEFLREHPECFGFFSQFSGIYLVRKPGEGSAPAAEPPRSTDRE